MKLALQSTFKSFFYTLIVGLTFVLKYGLTQRGMFSLYQASLDGKSISNGSGVPEKMLADTTHRASCSCVLTAVNAMRFSWVEWGGNSSGRTIWSENFTISSNTRTARRTSGAVSVFQVKVINFSTVPGAQRVFVTLSIESGLQLHHTTLRCCCGIIQFCNYSNEFVWPRFDISYVSSIATMSYSYATHKPTVYGGDVVEATCQAAMGTQDGDVAIWWKLSTPSKVQSWTGNYNGQVKLYPDWLTVTSVPGCLRCPTGETTLASRRACFKPILRRATWHDAREACGKIGSDLAVIRDRQTNNLIQNTTTRYWIGLNDIMTEGIYRWLDETQTKVQIV
ncbi:hypothetical protein RRG08_048734 [Elysia crispata]|uniref:C-type lectin domain-containing protein n=1 Tax=Elysia crispata TaxID=231223 RepID=A0AAE1D7B4_9GAST|nr:hypothetical protein RRG08_048734 [Elysia crispata]